MDENILLVRWSELCFLFNANAGHVIGSENIRAEAH